MPFSLRDDGNRGDGAADSRWSAPGDAQWWRDAVVYQVYVRSFGDENGDGIGNWPGFARD